MADPIDELRNFYDGCNHASLEINAILYLSEAQERLAEKIEAMDNPEQYVCNLCGKSCPASHECQPPEEKKEDELLDMFLFLWDYKASWKTNLRTIAFELRKDPNRWFEVYPGDGGWKWKVRARE